MTKLDKLDNARIEATEFQAPTGNVEQAQIRLTRAHWSFLIFALACVCFIAFISLAKSVQISAITPMLGKPDQYLAQPADVSIDSRLKLPLGNRVMLLPGKHTVSLQAPGFATLQRELEIGADRHQQFELVMTRLPGKLQVILSESIESVAQVIINGQAVAELPDLVDNLPAGEHTVTVDAPLYRPVSQTVLIRGKGQTESMTVKLDPAWAEYQFSSTPAGANLSVDDRQIGETPLRVKLEEGLRSVRIKAKGYKVFEREVGVVAEQDLEIPNIVLEPADGVIAINSSPSDAAVVLNGEYRGVTPLKLVVPPNQAQKVQVYKAGFQLYQDELTLSPEQLASKQIDLNQDLVAVQISVVPSDAEVYVDGVRRGRGTQTLNLNTLPHAISVRKPGYVEYSTELVPTRGNKQVVSVRLLTEEQHYWAQIPSSYTNRLGHKMKLFRDLGQVRMGSSRREAGRRANEVQFTAQLTKPFYVSLHETTNKQFRAFKASHNAGNYKKRSLDANKAPAVNVSWQQAALYCNWLSEKEGLDPFYQTRKGFVSGYNLDANGYRLLTEAEWAWLARNKDGENLMYPWGNSPRPTSARPIENFADEMASELIAFTLDGYNDGYKGPAPVGRFDQNHNGLFDMGGNASEWVNDWYSAKGSKEGASAGVLKDPIGPDIGEFHVVRGASWAKGHLPQLRLAYRDYAAKGKHDIGFRVARYAGLNKSKTLAVNRN